jgi:AcrR family transcriptional regulator
MAVRASTEARLLDAAEELFFTRGIAATPVDAVIHRAGVSSATLYRAYGSKEALVAAALDRRQQEWVAVWDRAVERQSTDEGRLLAVFDALDEYRTRPEGSRWCAFLGSAAEYADLPPEIDDALRLDTATFRTRLQRFARPLVADGAADLAEALLLVVTGSLAMRLRDPDQETGTARSVARAVLQAR